MRRHRFRDRIDAGQQLAELVAQAVSDRDVIVLGLPRGGVPVAAEVARRLDADLDAIVVRKVGVPHHEELAMGAVAAGVTSLNRDLIVRLGISDAEVSRAVELATREMNLNETTFRQRRPPARVAGRTVVVVDDGLATGASMMAAVGVLEAEQPRRIVVAVPVAAADSLSRVAETTETVCVEATDDFAAVGYWYDDFSPTTNDEVVRLLSGTRNDRSSDRPPSST